MKKFLIMPIVLVVLSGCVAQKDIGDVESISMPEQKEVMVQEMMDESPKAEKNERSITTDVAPIDATTSPDVLLQDIDAMMEELDAL